MLGVKPVEVSFYRKKPPGLLSADSASLCEPLKAIRGKEREKERNVRQKVYIKNGQSKETNTGSGARHRIFGGGMRSMGSARVSYPMHFAGGTHHQSGLGR